MEPNKKIERFEDLVCWQKSRELVNMIYEICEEPLLSKDFSTKDQIKRAALGAINNIAEGFGRYSKKEFVRFLDFASASGMEVRSMLYVLSDRKYISEDRFQTAYQLSVEQGNLTLGLIRYLTRAEQTRTKNT